MAKRRSMKEDPCPVARSLDAIGDRWSLLIVRDAFSGTRRFSDFQRSLGVARNILAERLRLLVDEGILAVQPVADCASYQEYVLTPKGERLFPVVVALRQWGERHLFERGEPHSRLLEIATGKAIARMEPLGGDGRALSPRRTLVEEVPGLP